MTADGSDPVNLTRDPAPDFGAVWSPDGTQLAFASGRDGNVEVYAMGRDGERPVNLTQHSAWDADPCWSPDGAFLAFSSDRSGSGGADLYLLGSGISPSPLIGSVGYSLSPTWSPRRVLDWLPEEPEVISVPAAEDTTQIFFADSRLADAVRREVGKPPGAALTRQDAFYLRSVPGHLHGMFSANRLDLVDLTGIAALEWIYFLSLDDNQIEDLSPLAGMLNLSSVSLVDNRVHDLRPLATLRNLSGLNVGDNPVDNLTPLAGLTHLGKLLANGCYLQDLSPLAGLVQLWGLQVGRNQIRDLSPLAGLTNLEELSLSKNPVVDLAPLAGLIQLRSLSLQYTEVTDLGPLVGLSQLTVLKLTDCPLDAQSRDTYLPLFRQRGVEVSW